MWYYNQEIGFVQNKDLITSKGLTAHAYTDAEKDALFASGLAQAHDDAGRLYCVEPEPIPEPEPMTLEEVIASYDAAIDARLEAFARELYSKGYANAVTYINSTNPVWALEARYLIELRDQTWMDAYNYLNEVLPLVQTGEREIPMLEDVFAVLPTPAWPEGSRGYKSTQGAE